MTIQTNNYIDLQNRVLQLGELKSFLGKTENDNCYVTVINKRNKLEFNKEVFYIKNTDDFRYIIFSSRVTYNDFIDKKSSNQRELTTKEERATQEERNFGNDRVVLQTVIDERILELSEQLLSLTPPPKTEEIVFSKEQPPKDSSSCVIS